MNVIEKKSEGLEREYEISIPVQDVETKITEKLNSVRSEFQMKGFRKGKAPLSLIRQMFGKSIHSEVVEEIIQNAVRQHMNDNNVRPSMQPEINVENAAPDAGADLKVSLSYEQLPEIPEINFEALEVERLEVGVSDEAIDKALENLAKSAQSYEEKEGAAEKNDQVIINFVGSIDGEEFEGGTGTDHPLVLGSNAFIPGFEDQLIGAQAKDEKDVVVTFPDDYGAKHLAGKEAVFKCTVNEVKKPVDAQKDDELAKKFGVETLDELKEQLSQRLKSEYQDASFTIFKRKVLDLLDENVSVELPQKLVALEAKQIARHLAQNEKPGETLKEEDIEVTDKHQILAERRVKLGLVMAHLGDKHEISVDENEVNQAIMRQAMQYRGQEKAFFDHVRGTPQLMQQFRAPLYEEKVTEQIGKMIKVNVNSVTQEELEEAMKALEEEDV